MTAIKPTAKKTQKKATKKSTKKAVKKASSKKSVKKTVRNSAKKVPAKAPKATKKVVQKKTLPKAAKSAPKKSIKLLTGMPSVGQLAPDFALKSDTNGIVSLDKYRGKNIVLYFYPKDDTPGCTVEACSFQENKNRLMSSGAVVIGASPDSVESHAKFRKKYGLDFILVADEDHKLAESYGVWVEKNMYGNKKMGIQRATFLIDANGRVAYVWPKVSVDGHTQDVLEQLNRL